MIVFSNTTPLIALSSIQQLELLPQLFHRVHVVREVVKECLAGGPIAVPDLQQLDWMEIVESTAVAHPSVLLELDKGEKHTIFHLYLPAEQSGAWRPADGETAADRARLTASFPTPRDAVASSMDTFPVVRRKDEAQFNGDYRTRRVILDIYDAMQQVIATGKPYHTRLDPPPADPGLAHPPRGQDGSSA